MRRSRPAALALLAAVALAGCGLPLGQGVHAPGPVPVRPALPPPIDVLPPDPLPGVNPSTLVESFLAAQTSGRDDHRIARGYLAAEQRQAWKATAGVTVYDPDTVTYDPSYDGTTAVVTVHLDVVGGVRPDGSAFVQPAVPTTQTYRARKDAAGQWRLVGLPDGLTLTPGERDRTYAPVDVYFLAPQVAGPTTRHLVADRLLLPSTDDPAQRAVERLLAGPSAGLGNSADNAVPTGTRLLSRLVTSADGEVTVDLSREAATAGAQQRQNLTAQLFWTLRQQVPALTRLRLLVEGRPLVTGQSAQARASWAAYDPNGPRLDPPAYALLRGSLAALDEPQETGRASPLSEVTGIVAAAVDPGVQSVAVLVEQGGTRTLRVGPLRGRPDAAGLAAGPADPDLWSPTWGSGERGVWLLRTGPRPALLVVAPDGGSTTVRVEGMPDLGPHPVLRVSRDGVRVALVAAGVLWIGRLEASDRGRSVRLVDLHPLAGWVLDVAWQTGTTLMVLVADAQAPRLPLVRMSVDGTSSVASGLSGVAQGDPVSLAASGDQPLLVETTSAPRAAPGPADPALPAPATYREVAGRGFEQPLPNIRRPFYPG